MNRNRAYGRSLSRLIIFLLSIRPLLNVFYFVEFFEIVGYKITILTIWSAIIFVLFVLRFLLPPKNKYDNLSKTVFTLIIIILLFGLPRVYLPSTIIKEVLYSILFLSAILISQKIFKDYSLYYFATKVYIFTIILLILHSTAWIWNPEYSGKLLNYLGAFPNKFLSSVTFLSIIPFLYIYYMKKKSKNSLISLILSVFFLLWTFRRTIMLAFFIGIIAVLIFRKNTKLIFYTSVIIVMIYFLLPSESKYLLFQKNKNEYEDYLRGDIDEIGSRRVGLYLRGISLFNEASTFEKVFGHGSAHSWYLSYLTWGKAMYAHGQYIATLYDYGLLGIFLLLMFFYFLISNTIKMYKSKKDYINEAIIFVVFSSIGITLSNILIATGGTSVLMSVLYGYPTVFLERAYKYENINN